MQENENGDASAATGDSSAFMTTVVFAMMIVSAGMVLLFAAARSIDFSYEKLYNVKSWKIKTEHFHGNRCKSCASPLLYSQIHELFGEVKAFCGNRILSYFIEGKQQKQLFFE